MIASLSWVCYHWLTKEGEAMNEPNTLGRRIQEGRRTAGLSQEALGEWLGVSRQAVSKWEADAAVPELENLIAMSRVFGVPVGVLLGVEEPGSLSERDMAAVEAVAARYEAARRMATGRQKLAALLGTGLLCVLLLAGAVSLWKRLGTMERRLDQLQSQVNSLPGRVYVQPPTAGGGESDSLLADHGSIITGFDPTAETVTLRVTAQPRERTTGTTAQFTARLSDGRQLTVDGVLEGDLYTAEDWAVPMDREIQLSVSFTDGETIRTAPMETLDDCGPDCFQLKVEDCVWYSSWKSANPSQVWFKEVDLKLLGAENTAAAIAPTAVELCLYRNRETEPERVLPVREALELWERAGMVDMSFYSGYETSITLEKGDWVVAALRVTDNAGRTAWTYLGGARGTSDQAKPVEFLQYEAAVDWTPGAALPAD